VVNSSNFGQTSPVSEVGKEWSLALRTMEIYPEMRNPPASLVRKHYEIEGLSRARQLPVRFLGYALLFSEPRVYRGAQSDWVMVNLKNDPLYYSNGERLIIPAAVCKDLKLILEAGINFDAMYIAHEISKGSLKERSSIPLELVAPPPPLAIQDLERKSQRWWGGIGGFLNTFVEIFSPAVIFENALEYRDPVLFGVLIDQSWRRNDRLMGMWYYVTSWRWPQLNKS